MLKQIFWSLLLCGVLVTPTATLSNQAQAGGIIITDGRIDKSDEAKNKTGESEESTDEEQAMDESMSRQLVTQNQLYLWASWIYNSHESALQNGGQNDDEHVHLYAPNGMENAEAMGCHAVGSLPSIWAMLMGLAFVRRRKRARV